MKLSEQEFERIVAEVVRRLEAMQTGQTAVPASHEVQLSERIVTLDTIAGRLAQARRLVVPGRAVVTPAVKDELKKRQIELVRK